MTTEPGAPREERHLTQREWVDLDASIRSLNESQREIARVRAECGVPDGESLYEYLGIPKWWEVTDG